MGGMLVVPAVEHAYLPSYLKCLSCSSLGGRQKLRSCALRMSAVCGDLVRSIFVSLRPLTQESRRAKQRKRIEQACIVILRR